VCVSASVCACALNTLHTHTNKCRIKLTAHRKMEIFIRFRFSFLVLLVFPQNLYSRNTFVNVCHHFICAHYNVHWYCLCACWRYWRCL